jgi:hypothetical protein
MHRLDAERKRQVAQWTAKLEKRFQEYGSHAAALFEKIAREHGLKAEPDWVRAGDRLSNEMDALDLEYEAEYLLIAKSTFESVQSVLNLVVNLSDPAEMRILSAAGTRKGLVDIADQTKRSIFQAIEQGRADGEGAAGIAGLIRDMVAAGPWGSAATRAMVIARTEAKYAQNISSIQAYKGGENITGVQVFDAQLGPTDEDCEMRNGRIVTFAVGELMVESEHPNGTISLAPYIGELPDDADVLRAGAEMPETKGGTRVTVGGPSISVPAAPVTVNIDNGGTKRRSVTIEHSDGTKSTAVIEEELVNVGGNGNGE